MGIRAEIDRDAPTARFLGTLRHGNGVVVDEQGTILTIGYLVLEAKRVSVLSHDGREFPAQVLAYDSHSGLGVLRASPPFKAQPALLGDSDALRVSDPLLILNRDPHKPFHTATVMGIKTFVGYWEYVLENGIHTVPPLENHAGAGLFDSNLRLVGIGSLYLENAGDLRDERPGNLFIPVSAYADVREDLLNHGRPPGPPRPWLGISLTEQFGRLMVIRVTPRGPADKAGVSVGDLLLSLNGKKVATMGALFNTLWDQGPAGVTVTLGLLQGNTLKDMRVQTRDRYAHYRNSPKGE